ncbi:MAG: Bug family tripartite tricarboxylate transporter substrate binding protein [Pseudolabrys sp.]
MKPLFRYLIASLSVLLLAPLSATAQQWPQRPVKIVVPYAAGGNTDTIARLTAQRLSETLGQQFIVENRGGAGGAIAADFVAKSAPDGYTLCVCALSQLAPVPLTQQVAYDPLKDFTPISNIGANGFVITVSTSVPAKTLQEFIAYAKANPGKLNYGSGGMGSLTHLAAALFVQRVGIDMTHVPYKGGAPALTDTIAGQVQMYAASPSEVLGLTNSDRVRLLGISSLKPISQLPNVPAIAQFYPGFQALTWNGMIGPANMPRDVVNTLSREIMKALKDPVFIEKLQKAGVEPMLTTPEEFTKEIQDEYKMWAEVITKAGIAKK